MPENSPSEPKKITKFSGQGLAAIQGNTEPTPEELAILNANADAKNKNEAALTAKQTQTSPDTPDTRASESPSMG